jgi:hypothetical protein
MSLPYALLLIISLIIWFNYIFNTLLKYKDPFHPGLIFSGLVFLRYLLQALLGPFLAISYNLPNFKFDEKYGLIALSSILITLTCFYFASHHSKSIVNKIPHHSLCFKIHRNSKYKLIFLLGLFGSIMISTLFKYNLAGSQGYYHMKGMGIYNHLMNIFAIPLAYFNFSINKKNKFNLLLMLLVFFNIGVVLNRQGQVLLILTSFLMIYLNPFKNNLLNKKLIFLTVLPATLFFSKIISHYLNNNLDRLIYNFKHFLINDLGHFDLLMAAIHSSEGMPSLPLNSALSSIPFHSKIPYLKNMVFLENTSASFYITGIEGQGIVFTFLGEAILKFHLFGPILIGLFWGYILCIPYHYLRSNFLNLDSVSSKILLALYSIFLMGNIQMGGLALNHVLYGLFILFACGKIEINKLNAKSNTIL